jgi:hypothetical protein
MVLMTPFIAGALSALHIVPGKLAEVVIHQPQQQLQVAPLKSIPQQHVVLLQ